MIGVLKINESARNDTAGAFFFRNNENKKQSENADTSTPVTFDLVLWPWPFDKVKKANVIRCALIVLHLSTRYDDYGINTLRDIPFVYLIWPLTFTCDRLHLSRSLETKNEVCSCSRIWNMDICMKKTYMTSHMTSSPIWFFMIF